MHPAVRAAFEEIDADVFNGDGIANEIEVARKYIARWLERMPELRPMASVGADHDSHGRVTAEDYKTRAVVYNQEWAGLHNAFDLPVPSEYRDDPRPNEAPMTTSEALRQVTEAAHQRLAGRARASSACPICGNSEPHAHGQQDIEQWASNQVARWGYKACLAPITGPEPIDALRERVKESLEGLATAQREWVRAYGWPRTEIEDVADLFRILTAASRPDKATDVRPCAACGKELRLICGTCNTASLDEVAERATEAMLPYRSALADLVANTKGTTLHAAAFKARSKAIEVLRDGPGSGAAATCALSCSLGSRSFAWTERRGRVRRRRRAALTRS